jgi:hypothetical protein
MGDWTVVVRVPGLLSLGICSNFISVCILPNNWQRELGKDSV